MNVENMRKVAEAIRNNPDHFDISNWFVIDGEQQRSFYRSPVERFKADVAEHACGTTACIAGWAQVLSGQPDGAPWDIGVSYLGLARGESWQLFYPDSEFWEARNPFNATAVADTLDALAEGVIRFTD